MHGSAYERRSRPTRLEDPQMPGQPDPVECIPSSDSPSHRMLILLPDPFQRLSELFGAGGSANHLFTEQGGETPELDRQQGRRRSPRAPASKLDFPSQHSDCHLTSTCLLGMAKSLLEPSRNAHASLLDGSLSILSSFHSSGTFQPSRHGAAAAGGSLGSPR